MGPQGPTSGRPKPRHAATHPSAARHCNPIRTGHSYHLLQEVVPVHGKLRSKPEFRSLYGRSRAGREKDIVILLTKRSHFEADRAEFLDVSLLLNVTIARSKYDLIILGH